MRQSTTAIPNDNGEISERRKQRDKMAMNNGSSVAYHPIGDSIGVKKDEHLILLEIPFQTYAVITVGAPILALLIAFLLGFSLDYQQILNYDWTCGVGIFESFHSFFCLNFIKSIK